jgi:Na+-transporting methylmalonyl-CoA/oxaloacetate decarboxylase gamma subunit
MQFVTLWDGVLLSLIGMASVFAVLALLGAILTLFRYIFYRPSLPAGSVNIEPVLPQSTTSPTIGKRKMAAVMAAISASLEQQRQIATIEQGTTTLISRPHRKSFKMIKMERWNHD